MRDKGFHEYVMGDLLSKIEGIKSRAMFGGWGIYQDGKIFALIANGKLYFKVGENNVGDYEKAGSKPFTYVGHNGKEYAMSYWELPVDVMENPDEISNWMDKSLVVNLKK